MDMDRNKNKAIDLPMYERIGQKLKIVTASARPHLEPPWKLRVGLGTTRKRNLVRKMRGVSTCEVYPDPSFCVFLTTPSPNVILPPPPTLPVPLILLIIQTMLRGT